MSGLSGLKNLKNLSRKKKKDQDLYTPIILTRIVYIPIINIGSEIKTTLLNVITHEISAKCISEGYIKPNSINIITYSNGLINGETVKFEVVLECLDLFKNKLNCTYQNESYNKNRIRTKNSTALTHTNANLRTKKN